MGVDARVGERVCVVKDGRVVEQGSAEQVFTTRRHDYTKMLLEAAPRLDRPRRAGDHELNSMPDRSPPVVEANHICVSFPVRQGWLRPPKILKAVDDVSLRVHAGETLGVVGESGSGKSTLARAVLRLLPEGSGDWQGSVAVLGRDLGGASAEQLRALRRDLQIVFQDPFASLDPRMTIGESVAQPLTVFRPELSRRDRVAKVKAVLERVGLPSSFSGRYPHELSGGQNQRVGIARAMILEPRFVVCDEAVSALDVSVRAQILELLAELQRASGIAMLFISHDLAVVREICHRVLVMYLGRVIELAHCEQLFSHPRHPYTRALLAAALTPDPVRERARQPVRAIGESPSPLDPKAALRFMPSRLKRPANEAIQLPRLLEAAPGHFVAEHDEC